MTSRNILFLFLGGGEGGDGAGGGGGPERRGWGRSIIFFTDCPSGPETVYNLLQSLNT